MSSVALFFVSHFVFNIPILYNAILQHPSLFPIDRRQNRQLAILPELAEFESPAVELHLPKLY